MIDYGEITIADRPQPVQAAEMTQFISTEAWVADEGAWLYGLSHCKLHYTIEIEVDDNSGDDGEPRPDFRVNVVDFPTPTLRELPGRPIHELGATCGWLGNGAPDLDDVNWTLVDVPSPGVVMVDLSATYRWRSDGPVERLHYAGAAELRPLKMRVKDPDDADAFLAKVFGGQSAVGAVRSDLDWWELGPSAPEDRRRWLTVQYDMPLL